MNVTLDKTSAVDGRIIVNVEKADYAEKVNSELRRFGQTHTIPGFRKGHVSLDQLRRRFGRQVKSDVLNNLVYDEVVKYIQENKLQVLGQPLPVRKEEINLEQDDYTFEYEVGFAPELNIKLDKDVKLPYYPIAVSDEMIEQQDENFRKRFGSQEESDKVDETAIVKGPIMQLTADGNIDESENAIQNLNGIFGVFRLNNEEQKKIFLGKGIDDKVAFNAYELANGDITELASLLGIDREKAEALPHDTMFQITISNIRINKPAEHDEKFFEAVFGKDKVHNEEEYREAVKQIIANDLAQNSRQLFRRDAEKYLLDTYKDMELPVEFLKKWLVASNEELTKERVDAEFADMLPSLQWQMIKDETMRVLDVKVTEDDAKNYARAMAHQQFAQYGMYNMDEETINGTADRILNDKNYRRQIVEQIANQKLFAAIFNAVTIDAQEKTLDQFRDLVDKVNAEDEAENKAE